MYSADFFVIQIFIFVLVYSVDLPWLESGKSGEYTRRIIIIYITKKVMWYFFSFFFFLNIYIFLTLLRLLKLFHFYSKMELFNRKSSSRIQIPNLIINMWRRHTNQLSHSAIQNSGSPDCASTWTRLMYLLFYYVSF